MLLTIEAGQVIRVNHLACCSTTFVATVARQCGTVLRSVARRHRFTVRCDYLPRGVEPAAGDLKDRLDSSNHGFRSGCSSSVVRIGPVAPWVTARKAAFGFGALASSCGSASVVSGTDPTLGV